MYQFKNLEQENLLILKKIFPPCYIIFFIHAIQNGSSVIMLLFSRNIFLATYHDLTVFSIKKLIALDILQALITFLLNKPAV